MDFIERRHVALRGRALIAIALPIALALAFCAAPTTSLAKKSAGKKRAPVAARTQDGNAATHYDRRADVLEFVDDLVGRHGFRRDELITTFARARYSETAARLMMPTASATRGVWSAYRARFVEPIRIEAGVRFWDAYAPLLERAEREYGAAPEIIVGILGVETIYGRNTGSFRVIDALTTLAFDYPNKARDRSPFFREQLEDYLLLARDTGAEVFALRGSYAGAIGMPQFMPGSIRRYAVDYDGDGVIDLAASPADVIGSVANFLAQHGWSRDLAPVYRLRLAAPGGATETLIAAGSEPSLSYDDLVFAGFASDTPLPAGARLALIDLQNGFDVNGNAMTEYVAGTQNFHVITQYNRSYFYAMSVIELGDAIKAARGLR